MASLRTRKDAAADAESRKKLFRATAGLSLAQQRAVATQLHATGDDMLQRIQQMKKTSTHQKQTTKATYLKYEWLHDHQHLKKLEEACTKDLETLLLRLYNDACVEKAMAHSSSSTSILKLKRSPRPEAEPQHSPVKKIVDSPAAAQYATELEALIQTEQGHRIALLKHVASEREQRQAMTQLMNGLRTRMRQSTSGAAVAVTERVKHEAQELIFDAVIGHQMVEATLEGEFKAVERDFQATYDALLASLRVGSDRKRISSNQTEGDNSSEDATDEVVNAVCGANGNELLRLEIREEFGRLLEELRDDLATYERDFHLLTSQEDAAGSVEAASSRTGGWSIGDDERYLTVLKNYERRPGGQKKPELLYDQVKAVLPHRDKADIRRHATFHTHVRFYQEKCRDRQADYDRKFAELQATAREKIAAAKQQQEDKAKRLEQLQQMQQQCEQLHDRVAEWRTTKEAEQRIKQQQDELERLLAQQVKEEEEARQRKRHEEQKSLVDDFRKNKLLGTMADELLAQQQREREEEEKAMLSAVNAERVQFRQTEYERKLAEDRLEQQRREQLELERLAKLDAIKQETPYADKIAAIVPDFERTRQETAAFRANLEAVDEGLPLNEKGLFPTHGYDCDTLFKNARFKLGIALRDAGLHSTEYARKALATIKVSNAGAYRHAVAPSTQIW